MGGYDRRLDPVTHDYVDDGAGGFETTYSAETAMQHAVLDEKRWWGDAEAGSRLYEMEREGESDPQMLRRVEAVREALTPLVNAGLISELEVTLEEDEIGRRVIYSRAKDVKTGAPVSVTTPLEPYGA